MGFKITAVSSTCVGFDNSIELLLFQNAFRIQLSLLVHKSYFNLHSAVGTFSVFRICCLTAMHQTQRV